MRYYLFQCGASNVYALCGKKHTKRRLPRTLADGEWLFRNSVRLQDLGRHYDEAAKLVLGNGYCILNLAKQTVLMRVSGDPVTLPISSEDGLPESTP